MRWKNDATTGKKLDVVGGEGKTPWTRGRTTNGERGVPPECVEENQRRKGKIRHATREKGTRGGVKKEKKSTCLEKIKRAGGHKGRFKNASANLHLKKHVERKRRPGEGLKETEHSGVNAARKQPTDTKRKQKIIWIGGETKVQNVRGKGPVKTLEGKTKRPQPKG